MTSGAALFVRGCKRVTRGNARARATRARQARACRVVAWRVARVAGKALQRWAKTALPPPLLPGLKPLVAVARQQPARRHMWQGSSILSLLRFTY